MRVLGAIKKLIHFRKWRGIWHTNDKNDVVDGTVMTRHRSELIKVIIYTHDEEAARRGQVCVHRMIYMLVIWSNGRKDCLSRKIRQAWNQHLTGTLVPQRGRHCLMTARKEIRALLRILQFYGVCSQTGIAQCSIDMLIWCFQKKRFL